MRVLGEESALGGYTETLKCRKLVFALRINFENTLVSYLPLQRQFLRKAVLFSCRRLG